MENNFETNNEQNENVNFESRLNLQPLQENVQKVKAEIAKVIVGQNKMIDQLLVAVLSNGHVLLEGVPGVAKTISAKLLAKTLSLDFSRIQFTPDLMPSDIIGTSVFDYRKVLLSLKKVPFFPILF